LWDFFGEKFLSEKNRRYEMKKIHVFIILLAILVLTAVPVLASITVYYSGQGTTNGQLDSIICGVANGAPIDGPYLFWVFTATSDETAIIAGPWNSNPMTKRANGAFQYLSNWYEPSTLIGVTYATALPGETNNPQLVISHGCPPDPGQWCSPGYWRQSHHLDSWAATGYSPDDLFYDALGYYPTLSKKGVDDGATTNPTLWQVLQSPQWYGGDAFNAVGDLLSLAHPDVNFLGTRVEDSCPLN
jgi:hypothetical protein